MSNLYYLLSTSFMSNILLPKLCCGRFCLGKVTPECTHHVMPLIWRWGRMEGSVGLPPGKNGGLSCFPHSVLRVHSAGRSVLADSGKNITRLHWALCGQGLCSESTDVWAHCWMLMCAALNARRRPTTHLGYLCYFREKKKKNMVHLDDITRQMHVMERKVKCGSEKKTRKRTCHCFQALSHKDVVVFFWMTG